MAIDSPLTCYICGETTNRKTVDLLGCLKDQKAAEERYKEKFGKKAPGFIDICPDCLKNKPAYAKNVAKKYGRHD